MAAAKETNKEEKTGEEIAKEPQAEKKVVIRIPKTKENAGPVFVSVNERTFLIQRGVPVEVPESVAEVIATSERYADEAMEFELAAQKN